MIGTRSPERDAPRDEGGKYRKKNLKSEIKI